MVNAKPALLGSTDKLNSGSQQWHPAEFHDAQARLGEQPIDLDETILFSSFERRMIWSSFWIGGQFTTSRLAVKLFPFKSILIGKEATALVALSTPIEGSLDDTRARLRSALFALQELPKQLDAASRPKEVPIAAD